MPRMQLLEHDTHLPARSTNDSRLDSTSPGLRHPSRRSRGARCSTETHEGMEAPAGPKPAPTRRIRTPTFPPHLCPPHPYLVLGNTLSSREAFWNDIKVGGGEEKVKRKQGSLT